MIYYVFENKLYIINDGVVQFFSTWNQLWWNSTVITVETLKEKGTKIL